MTGKQSRRDVTELHKLLGHPSEDTTRGTARTVGAELTGVWVLCGVCFEARVRYHAVLRTTDSCAARHAGRFFVDITGPFHDTCFAGSSFALLCVDDFTRFKMVCFLKYKSDATGAMRDIIERHVASFGLKLGIVCNNKGGEFDGLLQSLIKEFRIQHERTSPHTPE